MIRCCTSALMLALMLATACHAEPNASAAAPLSWEDVAQRPPPAPGEPIEYGPAPAQFGELRVPDGAGPFPVIVLLHGGCWLQQFDNRYLAHLAAALTRETGAATWNLEYRRLGEPGGGWPGTLQDVARGTDHLRALAPLHRLDLHRVIALGHSAGAQLALWLATRQGLPRDSELFSAQPVRIHAAIGLSAIADLAAYGAEPGGCNDAVGELLGGSPREVAQRYAQSSPSERLPLGIAQWLIQGLEDPIVSPGSVRGYAERARAAGDRVTLVQVEHAGHFEPALPATVAWPAVLSAVRDALR